MKNYQHWSTETLQHERAKQVESIADWERVLRETNSALAVLSCTHSIRKAKEKIHAIDAELCYREHA